MSSRSERIVGHPDIGLEKLGGICADDSIDGLPVIWESSGHNVGTAARIRSPWRNAVTLPRPVLTDATTSVARWSECSSFTHGNLAHNESDVIQVKAKSMGEARQIYLEACGKIAHALEADGFRWRKSRLDAVRQDEDLTFRVWFQSSFRNSVVREWPAAEENTITLTNKSFIPVQSALSELEQFGSIALAVHVSVHAQSIKEWRSTLAHPIRTDDAVAGTNIGHLAPKARWLEVNLANPKTRSGRIQAMIDLLRTAGFHYFDRFRHPDEVVAALFRSKDPGMLDYMELEYAVRYGSTEAGFAVLQRYLQQGPECAEEYREALHEYRQRGIPATLHGRSGPRLARMALALGTER